MGKSLGDVAVELTGLDYTGRGDVEASLRVLLNSLANKTGREVNEYELDDEIVEALKQAWRESSAGPYDPAVVQAVADSAARYAELEAREDALDSQLDVIRSMLPKARHDRDEAIKRAMGANVPLADIVSIANEARRRVTPNRIY